MTGAVSGGVTGARLLSIQPTEKTTWLFVEVVDGDGLAGWGEASLSGQADEVAELARRWLPLLCGRSADDPAAAGGDLPFATQAMAAASSGVMQALSDLAARRAGASLADHLCGRRRDRVGLYANFNRRTRDRSPEGMAESAADALAAGFNAFKIAPFDEVRPDLPRGEMRAAMQPGIARLAAIRDALGASARLMADCHWRFDTSGAEEMIDAVSGLGLYWVECPVAETEATIPDTVLLRGRANRLGMRLAGLETRILREGFRPWLKAGAYDVMMPDVKYAGGPAEMLEIAAEFATYGVAFSPHNPTGPICHAHSLHVCAALADSDLLEVQFDETPEFAALTAGSVPAMDGGISGLPGRGAGLGLEFIPDQRGARTLVSTGKTRS